MQSYSLALEQAITHFSPKIIWSLRVKLCILRGDITLDHNSSLLDCILPFFAVICIITTRIFQSITSQSPNMGRVDCACHFGDHLGFCLV